MPAKKINLPEPTPEQMETVMQAITCFANGLALISSLAAPEIQQQAAVVQQTGFTLKDAANYLGVSKSTINRLKNNGELKYRFSIGSTPMFHKDDLDRIMNKGN